MAEAKANLYKISGGMAKMKEIPIFFVATILKETERAVYLYGHGTTETTKMGVCCKCGRQLTHPVSIQLGIGPECGQHWHDWNRIGGYSLENIERLKTEIRKITIDTWMPRSCILSNHPTEEKVVVPDTHPMVSPIKREPVKQQTKELILRKVTLDTTTKGGFKLKISFPYFTPDIDRIKTLSGREYNPKDKTWLCPFTTESLEKLGEWGFVFDPTLSKYTCLKAKQKKGTVLSQEEMAWLRDIQGDKASIRDVSPDEIDHIPGLKGELMPFQKAGVAFLERKKGRAIIGDEMGLGKTVQVLAWLQLHPELRPAVIVCPAVAKGVWYNHIRDWMSNAGKVNVIQGSKPEPLHWGDIFILNYDILPNTYEDYFDPITQKKKKKEIPFTGWVDYLIGKSPKVVIMDECHYIKSNSANRTKGVKKLAKDAPHVIPVSGTFIINRPIEGYNAIWLVDKNKFPNYIAYGIRFCGGKRNRYGWDFSGATNLGELHQELQSLMIRRTKKEVLPDLPDKMLSFVPLELKNREDYDRADDEIIDWIRENVGEEKAIKAQKAKALVRFNYLKQIVVKGKIDGAIAWIRDFLESDSGKLLVFATYKETISRIMKEFKGIAVKVDGDTSPAMRPYIENQFQTDPNIRLFVGNTQAAGVALTLTAASSVAYIELPWTPGEVQQAVDRCHRYGQKNAVTVYFLLAEGTVEDDIAQVLDKKKGVLSAVMDGKDLKEVDDSLVLTELINRYKSKKRGGK